MTNSSKSARVNRMTSFTKSFKIFEKSETYVFINPNNIHIELDKQTGSFVDGNLFDCDDLKPLFNKLFSIAKSLN
jgi:hypothetical protein